MGQKSNTAKLIEQEKNLSRRHDKTVHSRSNRRKKARIYIYDEEIDEEIDFEKYDLSTVGAYLYSQYLFCTGDNLNLKISIPGVSEPLLINSVVVRAGTDDDCGIGVAFKDLSAKSKRILNNYITTKFLNEFNK
ncbi:MAG: PilZ domain-containing protein [Deltaproteobacteria bacterium]|nr:PilZ domain-containing protein [Deltaproteobacteria bacterium]